MKKIISIMLACLLVFGAFPLSLIAESGASEPEVHPAIGAKPALDEGDGTRQINTSSIAIDSDPDGGYEGDYVVIYNPSESATSSMSTGNMSGLIDTTISANMMDTRGEDEFAGNEMYRIDVDQYLAEEARKLMGDKPLPPDGDGTKATSYNVGDTANFKLSYYSPFSTSTVQFKVVAKGDHCYVWTPSSSGSNSYPLSSADAQTAMQAFESKFDTMNSSFGDHRIGNGDGRVNILYYNINDGWNGNGGYIGGYFWGGDYSSGNNNLPIIHIDTYPSVYYNNNGVENSFSTLVHEYQHMIHYNYAPNSHSWINETMSAAAEEICYPGSSIFSRIMYYTGCEYSYNAFANPPKEYAAQHANLHYGYSMYDWSNDLSDVLALYAQVSLFSQYLYTQYPQDNRVFNDLLTELARGKTFQEACPFVFGMSASSLVRDFRIALAANTAQNVLDGKYGWVLQPGYDPNEYYGIQNLYNLLGPIIFQSNSCNIKGGGAITVKPVGGGYNPPSDANAGLSYYGIKLNSSGGDIPEEPDPTPIPMDGELFTEKSIVLEADGTYTISFGAYSTGTPHDASSILRFYFAGDVSLPSRISLNVLKHEFSRYENGEPVFSPYGSSIYNDVSVNASYYASSPNRVLLTVSGFDFSSNIVNGSGGSKIVFKVYGVSPRYADAVGMVQTNDVSRTGIYSSSTAAVPDAVFPDENIMIGNRYAAYDFGSQLVFSEEGVSDVLSIDSAFPAYEVQNGAYVYSTAMPASDGDAPAYSATISENRLSFDPLSINTDSATMNALIRLDSGSYEWTKLTFIPATMVLYEEGFLNYADGALGEPAEPEYTDEPAPAVDPTIGIWSVVGTPGTAAQTAGGVFGYDAAYAASTGDSNGSAMSVTVNDALETAIRNKVPGAKWPTASFTFTGTGLDIVTRCTADSGVYVVDLVPEGQPFGFMGDNAFHVIVISNFTGDFGDMLHQIPLLSIDSLEYGSYKVRIRTVYYAAFDLAMAASGIAPEIPGIEDIPYEYVSVCDAPAYAPRSGSFTSYIDAIRIYDPLGTGLSESAYAEAGELNPVFKNLRKMLKALPTDEVDSVLNLKLDEQSGSATPATYEEISPSNEIYLKHGMSVAFGIEGGYSAVHLSLKSPNGSPFKVKINGEYLKDASGNALVITHTAELYYDISSYVSGDSVSIVSESVDENATPVLSLVRLKLIPSASSNVQPSPTVVARGELVEFVEAVNFGILGDADHDRSVTVTDALLVMRAALVGTELGTYGRMMADVNADGTIDLLDALAIMRMALEAA